MRVVIEFEGIGEVECELSSAVNPGTYEALVKCIPFQSKANVWGKEVYFRTPASHRLESGVKEVEVGDIAFWPPGRALCLFFGPTPESMGDKPVAASRVNVIGRIVKNIELLEKVRDGDRVRVRLAG